ncbi:MAG: 3-oxoacyl-ACP reductase FabG [Chloroflexi bacterium]|nr:3-oxoacyl-ACP reductase FabG [Chloroflexota bacterium]MCI0785921.1 3-oxoacyl-ACP reductase FabG [Chloroflexota bacterium]MCI0794594.1 3-oxoacyl-ACP reductase FabG [Chloroflexota bacterium]MCI0798499.1 3-oxoacyl-ACP reductase FabG [Chloroflexota bacterium]MCI0824833.1 3-oxoacyl-ACP reductase FabG [Chloroflexota bacterium]
MALDGKVALVTGSGRNIGRSIALALAKEGANVVVNARTNRKEAESVAEEVRALGAKAIPMLADVGDREQLEAMLDQALAEFGRIDIVVNNAATRPHKPFAEMSYEDWRGVLATDLDSAFLSTKAALPGMVERKWGRVINLSGLQAFQGRHGGAHISAAKVGLIGFTRALATELAPDGILVNCIVPGLIDTTRDGEARTRPSSRLSEIPVGRMGEPQDIASLCSFLCSDAAGFITGQTIHVNGGERDF